MEKMKAMAEDEGSAAWKVTPAEDDGNETSSAESMFFISLSVVSSSTSAKFSRTSFNTSGSGEDGTKPADSMEEIRGRVAALQGRVVKALASITY